MTGARVLDLFAGTGALGLEALSRGAVQATFVDDGVAARALIRGNVELARAGGVTRIWRRDATDLGPCRGGPYGLVFLDPPYGLGLGERALALGAGRRLARPRRAGGLGGKLPRRCRPKACRQLDQRRYGDTLITLCEAA